MFFLPPVGALHGADTQRRLRLLRRRAAVAALLMPASWSAPLLLPDGLPPAHVAAAVLGPTALLLALGILDALLLALGPLLRPLLGHLPDGSQAVLDGGAWRLLPVPPAHRRLAFEAAAARGCPRLAILLLPHLLKIAQLRLTPHRIPSRLVAVRADGWHAILLADCLETPPLQVAEGILYVGIPLLVMRLPTSPDAPSPLSQALL